MPKSKRCSCEGCRKKLQLVDTLSGICRWWYILYEA